MNCAVFASGGGSNFQALIDRKESGDLHVNFALLISNNSKAFACERAKNHGIPVVHLPPSRFESEDAYTSELLKVLDEYAIEMIALAGYMKMIPSAVIQKFRNKILNIHPALLPSFGGKGMYGKRVHQAVFDHGVKISGITVHFVDEEYDKGPIILQATAPVIDDDTPDTLAERILKVEHENYWRAVEAVAQNRITVNGRRVVGEI